MSPNANLACYEKSFSLHLLVVKNLADVDGSIPCSLRTKHIMVCIFFTCENQLKEQALSAEPEGQTLRIEGSFKDKPKFEGWVKKEFLIARQLPPIWM